MTLPVRRFVWVVGAALLGSLSYAAHTLSQIAPVGTAYAAKALCNGVFVSGRAAAGVIAVDIKAGVHPLLTLVEPTLDLAHHRTRATLLGLAAREAQFRPDLGCTLALGVSADDLLASTPAAMPAAAPSLPLAAVPDPGVDTPRLQQAIDGAFAEADSAPLRRTRAVVVVHHGRLIAERYAPGFAADMALPGWSMTKSVAAVLVGVLVGQNRLSPEQADLLPAWHGDGRARITLDQLLRMTSGLRFNEDYDDPLADVAQMLFARPNAPAFAAAMPLAAAPGTRFAYSSGTSAILAAVLRDALGGSLAEYQQFPRRALFAPLGMRSAVMTIDTAGMLATESSMHASARDWARFGQLLLQDGVWDGRRLLPAGWVRYMATPTAQSPRQDFGAHLWVKVPEPFNSRALPPPKLPADAFHAVGHEGQFVSVIPSRELVVVRLGLTRPESAWDHETFLAQVLAAIPADRH